MKSDLDEIFSSALDCVDKTIADLLDDQKALLAARDKKDVTFLYESGYISLEQWKVFAKTS